MNIAKKGRFLLMGLVPYLPSESNPNDNLSKGSKTYKAYLERVQDDGETGMDRIKMIFQLDEFGSISSEMNSIYQSGFVGFFIGALYGGFINSREAYFNFMENNQATAFKSHLDAKRKLQDEVTMSFAKGSFRWGWRLGLFTTSYLGIVTFISVYRAKSSIYEYMAAGTLTGAISRINMGLRGMTSGGVVGAVLGGVAGGASLLLLKASGTSMEEIRYWQYKWRKQRDEQVQGAMKSQVDRAENTPALLKDHDERVGEEISLQSIK